MQRLIVLGCCALVASVAMAADISTVTTDSGRYLSVLGRSGGATMAPWFTGGSESGPSGIHDIASNAGNAEQGHGFTDGDLAPGNGIVTWGPGQNPNGPHYQGLKFKRAATIASLDWHNFTYGDGGTFAAAPAIDV